MTNEISIAQSKELTIAKQEAEILKLKFELERLQAHKASRLEDSLFSPTLFPHYQKVAETLAKSGVIPTCYKNKPEDIFVAMAMGYQLGFPVEQSLQDIAVINGRPCLWGDGLMALVLTHPECEGVDEEPIYTGQVITGYICTVKRKGHNPHTKSYTIDDANKANLLKKGGAWATSEARMLQLRARAFALRDKFADALRGLRQAEVERDSDDNVIEGEIISSSAEDTQVSKLKNMLKNNSTKRDAKAQIDTSPICDDDILEIQRLIEEKKVDEVRKLKMMDYFKVTKLVDLTASQAKLFLSRLSKI